MKITQKIKTGILKGLVGTLIVGSVLNGCNQNQEENYNTTKTEESSPVFIDNTPFKVRVYRERFTPNYGGIRTFDILRYDGLKHDKYFGLSVTSGIRAIDLDLDGTYDKFDDDFKPPIPDFGLVRGADVLNKMSLEDINNLATKLKDPSFIEENRLRFEELKKEENN